MADVAALRKAKETLLGARSTISGWRRDVESPNAIAYALLICKGIDVDLQISEAEKALDPAKH